MFYPSWEMRPQAYQYQYLPSNSSEKQMFEEFNIQAFPNVTYL